MHPELDALGKTYAEKQVAFIEVNRLLDESSDKLVTTSVFDPAFYALSDEHTKRFEAWSKVVHEINDAAHRLGIRAQELANEQRRM